MAGAVKNTKGGEQLVYQWKRNMPVKAQTVGEHFERLEQCYGHITPKIVIDDSRNKEALLHECFEWDDAVAAEKYREAQAGGIIRNLTVKVETCSESEEPIRVRAFVSVTTDTAPEYQSVLKVLADDELKSQLFESAKKELQAFRDKYSTLQELAEVFASIENLQEVI